MDDNTGTTSRDMRIDTRILKHLLREATDLLEEAQTHALVERHGEPTTHALARTSWRMTATCLWAVGELFPVPGDGDRSMQLHAPAPVFSCEDGAISPQLSAYIQRVDRLHERARRLDDLSRGPMVSSGTAMVTDDRPPAPPVETRPAATVIPLFGTGGDASEDASPIEQARSRMRRAMAGHE